MTTRTMPHTGDAETAGLTGTVIAPRPPAPDSFAPVLDARRRGEDGLLGRVVGRGHPVRTFLAGVALAYLCVAGLSVIAGLVVTHLLGAHPGVAHDDERFVTFLSHHRSGGLTEASLLGSMLAGGAVLPIVVAGWAAIAAAFRQWRVGAFLVFVLGVESAAYRTTTLVVHRHRPTVPRLEHLPVNASYPSGHTAAAIVVYCGIVLLVSSRTTSPLLRTVVWTLAPLAPLYVALSRMYRGMHHPLDVAGGVLIGIAALTAMVFVARAADRSASARTGG
jgi:membrane-associated phospholipid phosphatase